MKLAMVGTGYVGLVTGACLANTGNDVTCLDIDEGKIDMLNRGGVPIYEPGLKELIDRNRKADRLFFTTDKRTAYDDADVIFICVGTPSNTDGGADLSYVLNAANDIADSIQRTGADHQKKLVVVKSTVPVGTTYVVREAIRERTSVPFLVANNPEFLKEGAAIQDFMKPDRVVCGVDSEEAGTILRDLYEPFVRQGNPIIIVDIRSSEMIKYASNAMLACKISFINEIANLCEYYGADVRAVRQGMCADHRIGNQFLYPGLGYGGSCFPKDTLAVVQMAREAGMPCPLNEAVHQVNQYQRTTFWRKIVQHFGEDLTGKTLAFWGIAFKPETDDIREAPAITLIQSALAAGANVRAFDPVAAENLVRAIPQVTIVDQMYEALNGADALVLCTEWSEFRHPDFDEIAARLNQKVLFDGRNVFAPSAMKDLGFSYYSIGQQPIVQPHQAQAT